MMRSALQTLNGLPKSTPCLPQTQTALRLSAHYSRSSVENASQPAVDEAYSHLGKGSIEVIMGPMFSGKTTTLMNRIETAQQAGRKVVAIKSAIDTRYAITQAFKSFIVCHSGGRAECYSVNKLAQVKEVFSEEYRLCDLIVIDEAQFFPDLVDFCREAADLDGKRLCVAGLDGDYLRQPFKLPCNAQPIADLLPISDKVTKKLAQCKFCDLEAPFTFRCSDDSEEILVGGGDMYVPVCRSHYLIKSLDRKLNTDDIE